MLDPTLFAPYWGWLIAGLVLGIAEIIVPGVFLIWLGLAAVLTGLVTMIFGLDTAGQFIVFAITALLSVYAGRRFLKENPIETTDPLLNDRAARLIGQTVLVVDPIEGGEGRVKVGDGVWIARGPDTPPGARVRVTRAEGATLFVEPL